MAEAQHAAKHPTVKQAPNFDTKHVKKKSMHACACVVDKI